MMIDMNATCFAVVTFGTPVGGPNRTIYRTEERARKAAALAKGTGTCTDARVIACASRFLAATADISVCREGERTVWCA
jgi:hypothetical protein